MLRVGPSITIQHATAQQNLNLNRPEIISVIIIKNACKNVYPPKIRAKTPQTTHNRLSNVQSSHTAKTHRHTKDRTTQSIRLVSTLMLR